MMGFKLSVVPEPVLVDVVDVVAVWLRSAGVRYSHTCMPGLRNVVFKSSVYRVKQHSTRNENLAGLGQRCDMGPCSNTYLSLLL